MRRAVATWVCACVLACVWGGVGAGAEGGVATSRKWPSMVKNRYDRLMWTLHEQVDDVGLVKERLAEFGERGSEAWLAALRWGNWSSKADFVEYGGPQGQTTPLGTAAEANLGAICYYFMKQGALPSDPAEGEGFTAADKAAFSQRYEALWAMLDAGHVDALSQLSPPDGVAPIHRFVWELADVSDSIEFLRAAFAAGVDPELRDESGKSLLRHAMERMGGGPKSANREPRYSIAKVIEDAIDEKRKAKRRGDSANDDVDGVPLRDEM